jgi:serine/threonine protein kinase
VKNNVASSRTTSSAPSPKFIYNKIRYIGNRDLYDYMQQVLNTGHPEFIRTEIMDKFDYIAHSMDILRQNKIIHYDFKANNVMTHDTHNTPIIIDFGLSIDINKLLGDITEKPNEIADILKRAFYVYGPDYVVWCCEITFICYLLHERGGGGGENGRLIDPITNDDIKTVCDDFMAKNPLFSNGLEMDERTRVDYYNELIQFFQGFVGRPGNEVVLQLIEYYTTWDIYALSTCYINILHSAASILTGASGIAEFTANIRANIHANPTKRPPRKI